jgi:hypothetical protein
VGTLRAPSGWLPTTEAMSWCADRLPLAAHCVLCGRYKPPRFLFFGLSGSLCNLAQLGLDRMLLLLIGRDSAWYVPTVCWTASYTLSVALRHVSHSVFVFGVHADPVWKALAKTYLTYLSTIVASAAINLMLIGALELTHEVALVFTASFSVVWSYAALRVTWRAAEDGLAAPQGYHSVRAAEAADEMLMPEGPGDVGPSERHETRAAGTLELEGGSGGSMCARRSSDGDSSSSEGCGRGGMSSSGTLVTGTRATAHATQDPVPLLSTDPTAAAAASLDYSPPRSRSPSLSSAASDAQAVGQGGALPLHASDYATASSDADSTGGAAQHLDQHPQPPLSSLLPAGVRALLPSFFGGGGGGGNSGGVAYARLDAASPPRPVCGTLPGTPIV